MVSEPQSQGKENQQEETATAAAAAAAGPTSATALAASARCAEERARALESCVFPARLGAWFGPWGSRASWRGVKPHCHPVTPPMVCGGGRAIPGRAVKSMDAARILRRDLSLPTHK